MPEGFSSRTARPLETTLIRQALLLIALGSPVVAIDIAVAGVDALPDAVGFALIAGGLLFLARQPLGRPAERMFGLAAGFALIAALGAVLVSANAPGAYRTGIAAVATLTTELALIAGVRAFLVAMRRAAHHHRMPISRASWRTSTSVHAWMIEVPFVFLATRSIVVFATSGVYMPVLDMPPTWWIVAWLVPVVHIVLSLLRSRSEFASMRTQPRERPREIEWRWAGTGARGA